MAALRGLMRHEALVLDYAAGRREAALAAVAEPAQAAPAQAAPMDP